VPNYGDLQNEIYLTGLSGVVPSLPMSFAELERRAELAMPPGTWSYVAGGAGDEHTQRSNRTAFDHWGLVPRMLRAQNERDLSVDLFGITLPTPLFLSPIGVIGICTQDGHGDLATARAAAATGVPMVASTLSEDPMEQVAAESGETDPVRRRGFVIRTDGAARGNPGPASLGAALFDLDRPDARDDRAVPDASISDYLGIQTNNVAEYTGVVRALDLARELGAREVHLLLDSKLIVEQLAGRWRVKDAKLIPLWTAARRTLAGFDRWSAAHVPRALNTVADALANEAIDRAQAGGPASVVRRPRA